MKKLSICQVLPVGLMLLGVVAMPEQALATVPVFNNATDPAHLSADYKFTGFSSTAYPTYPVVYPGLGAWPSPIKADGNLAAAQLNRADATQSTDFLAASDGDGIYAAAAGLNTVYTITGTSPLASLSTITLQLYMAEGVDSFAVSNFYYGTPSLTLSLVGGGTASPTLGSTSLSAGTTGTSSFGPTTLRNLTLTWDLSGVSTPVSSYVISFGVAQHSVAYGMDLTEVSTQAVPEPSTWAMMIAGSAGLLFVGYRRTRATVASID